MTGQPGALRAAISRELADGRPHSAARLAQRTGWSVSAVRRELGLMEQLGLARSWKPTRTIMWAADSDG